jgi:hypothetical protein
MKKFWVIYHNGKVVDQIWDLAVVRANARRLAHDYPKSSVFILEATSVFVTSVTDAVEERIDV